MGSNEFKKSIARTFIFLLDSKEPSASALLAEALAEKTARIQVWAVLAATRRPDRRLLLDVLRAYGDLCERARRIVIRNGPAFLPVLRDALTADRPSEREGALALACRIGGARTAHLLALALSGQESALREAAARKLAEIVAEYHRDAAKARGRSNRS